MSTHERSLSAASTEKEQSDTASATYTRNDSPTASHVKRSLAKDIVLIGTVTLAMILNVSTLPPFVRTWHLLTVNGDCKHDCGVDLTANHWQRPQHYRIQVAVDRLRLLSQFSESLRYVMLLTTWVSSVLTPGI